MSCNLIILRCLRPMVPELNRRSNKFSVPGLMFSHNFNGNFTGNRQNFRLIAKKPQKRFRTNPLDHETQHIFKDRTRSLLMAWAGHGFADAVLSFIQKLKKQYLFRGIEFVERAFGNTSGPDDFINTRLSNAMTFKQFSPIFPQNIANRGFFCFTKSAWQCSPLYSVTSFVKWSYR